MISPCGHTVELLRSCYSAKMRFFHDSEKERTVDWYFVPEDTPALPFAHAFGSALYDRDEMPEGAIGERFEPVPWRGGQPPCPAPSLGICGSREQWKRGVSIEDKCASVHRGTLIPTCCKKPLVGSCGGIAIGRAGFGACHMESTFDVYRPFGNGAPLSLNTPCQFVEDLFKGGKTLPINNVMWTHYIDVAVGVDVLDGITRTVGLNILDYADGDEVRIPTGGSSRYVVVWVTLCDIEGTTVKRVYLLRHAA